MLEKADKVYRQLIANKPELEQLLLKVQDGADLSDGEGGGGQPRDPSTVPEILCRV